MAMFSQLKEQLADAKEAKGKADAEAKEEAAEVVEKPALAETPEVSETPAEVETVASSVEEEVAETVAEAPAAEVKEPKAKASKAKSTGDDLKIIEGIGPKIEEILHEAGINSFAALAAKGAEEIREILLTHGSRFKMFDPTTWPEQSQLAADGKLEELEVLKKALNAGKKE